jgi:hypothetical protein
MSLTNPVISDLIVATYDQDRHAEVEKVRTRRDASLGVTRTARAVVARGVDRLGALGPGRSGWRSRRAAAVPTGCRVLVPARSGSDDLPC